MAEKVRFPHAAKAVIDVLNAELPADVRAYPKVPAATKNPKPAGKFVVIRTVGGVVETLVTSAAQITVDGYASADDDAYDVCDLALSIIRSQDDVVRGARGFGYPQNLPDPTTSQVRYTSTGEVRVWGAATP